jgi:hypothetical protein
VPKNLIVANQTLGGSELAELVRDRSEHVGFHVIVPTTAQGDRSVPDDEAIAYAKIRLGEALLRFGELGAEVTGEVAVDEPLHAIEQALVKDSYDAIIISTLPSGASRWLHLDLPHRVERKFDLPVVTVESTTVD